MIGFSKESNDNLKIENNELLKFVIILFELIFFLIFNRKKQIAEMQSRMYSLKDEVGRKNEVLGQRIQEMELAKKKFEEELKKFNSKNVNTNIRNINFISSF